MSERASTQATIQDTDQYTDQNASSYAYVPAHILRVLPTNGTDGYTPADRYNAALAWSITGTATAAAEHCGIPASTITNWTNQAWWNLLVNRASEAKRREMDGRMQGLLERALDQVQDRLDHGDVTLYQGVTVRHPVRARDATVIAAIMYDKLALLRGQATSRVERINLGALREQLGQVYEGNASHIVQDANPNIDSPADSKG